MDVDPIASMRCWSLTVELGGREYEIPALPAADWWPVIAGGDLMSVTDLFTKLDDFDEMLLDGTIDGAELGRVLTETVEQIAGRSLHVTYVLATVAGTQWPVVGGQLAQDGFRWDVMPIGAALDAIYSLIVNGLEDENRKKFLALLDNEALTTPKDRRRTPDREKIRSEFEQFAGPPPTAGALSTGVPSDNARPRTRRRPRPPHPDDPSPVPTQPPGPPAGSDPPASS
jgi:hypothetical protein